MSACEDIDGRLISPIPDIDFRDQKDLVQEARDRFLWEFKNSPDLCSFMALFVGQAEEMYNLTIDALELRTLSKAEKYNLDVIGRLVGQQRVGITASLGLFGFADDPTAEGFSELIDGAPVGGGRFIELNESDIGPRYLEDAEYKRFILGKIYKNHLRGATACELAEIAVTILDSVTKCRVGDGAESATVDYYFYAPLGITNDDRLIIESVVDDVRSERQRIITVGAGIRINTYTIGSGESVFGFADDTDPNTGGFGELTDPSIGGNFSEIL